MHYILILYIHEYLYALNAYPAHMYIIFPCQTTLTVHIPGTHLPRTEHWLPKVHLMPRPILIKNHKRIYLVARAGCELVTFRYM